MKESTQKSLDVLSRGINQELAAYVFYMRASEKINDNDIKKMMTDLAGEEKDHYWVLEGEYDSLIRSEKWVTYNDIMRKSELPEIPEEMSENHKKRLDTLDTIDDPKEILGLALELEKEAYELYHSQIEKFDDPIAKEMMTFLSKFELAHVKIIQKRIDNL
jgi:rubrerythrin